MSLTCKSPSKEDRKKFYTGKSKSIHLLINSEKPYKEGLPRLSGGSAYDVICGSREALITAFKKKTGIYPKYESEEMKQGKIDEEKVLQMFEICHDKPLVPGPRNHLSHPEYPDKFTACIDAYCEEEGSAVEVKTCQTTSICSTGNPKHEAQMQFYLEILHKITGKFERMYYVQFKRQGPDPEISSTMLNVRVVKRDKTWWQRYLPKFLKYVDYLVDFGAKFQPSVFITEKPAIDLYIEKMCEDILSTPEGDVVN